MPRSDSGFLRRRLVPAFDAPANKLIGRSKGAEREDESSIERELQLRLCLFSFTFPPSPFVCHTLSLLVSCRVPPGYIIMTLAGNFASLIVLLSRLSFSPGLSPRCFSRSKPGARHSVCLIAPGGAPWVDSVSQRGPNSKIPFEAPTPDTSRWLTMNIYAWYPAFTRPLELDGTV